MKILTLDIETSPHKGFHFGLFNQNFSLQQVEEWTRVLAFAAKWYDEPDVLFYSDFHDGHDQMVKNAFGLLEEADVLVTYNGDGFDLPHLNREFELAELGEPAPYQSVDLWKVNKKKFKFGSTKLDHLAQQLGIGQKVKHAGFQLWIDCLNGDINAWNKMREYNKEDVVITEKAFTRLKSWVPNLPHAGLYNEVEFSCRCGSTDLEKRGFHYTQISKFQRYKCRTCGRWSKSSKAEFRVEVS
jgi:DNA polymerase elongation subunit (family B)